MSRASEIAEKHRRLAAWLEQRRFEGVILRLRENFAWFTAGGDNHVGSDSAEGVASLLVTGEKVTLITTNIEAPRLLDEELGGLAEAGLKLEVVRVPWHGDEMRAVAERIEGRRIASDTGVAGTVNAAGDLVGLRAPLTADEVAAYREIGPQAAAALEAACAEQIRPGMDELAVQGVAERALLDRGLVPSVLLVGSDERIDRYRHPIPTPKRVERKVMVVVCARRRGLTVALTRLVHFGPLPADLKARHRAVCGVDAALHKASRPGRPLKDVLADGVAAYAAVGFPDEWENHHQGGPIGYRNRERIATPAASEPVTPWQALAWNPSIRGTKSEDTILVDDQGRYEVLTAHGSAWPSVEVAGGLRRPGILLL